MELRRIDHIGIRVADFARSIAFYGRLGFDCIRNDEAARVVVLRHPSGVELNLLDNVTATPDTPETPDAVNILMDIEQRHAGYTHYAIEVPSVRSALGFLVGLGLAVSEGPVTFGDGKTSVFIRDPDRNVIEFTELPAA
jgi:lactoylglutathione lyase